MTRGKTIWLLGERPDRVTAMGSRLYNVGISPVEEDFDGIDREDNIDTIDFSATYLMNRRARLELAYSHRDRDSDPDTPAGFRYSRGLISLSAIIHW